MVEIKEKRLKNRIESFEPESWVDLLDYYRNNFPPEEQWIFRGQSDASWNLETTLERALSMYGVPVDKALDVEKLIIRDFLRKINNYSNNFSSKDTMECLSFIQHHGGPTRLLDWTYSFYIAAFFALSSAKINSQAAIWCFRSSDWDKYNAKQNFFTVEGAKIFNKDPRLRSADVQALFELPKIMDDNGVEIQNSNVKRCVYPLSSHFLNPRIERQQGVFLVQTSIASSFEDNVERMLDDKHFQDTVNRIVITCSEKMLNEALLDLRRMSITYESLFVDLAYFCKSLSLGMITFYNLLTDSSGNQYMEKSSV